MKEHLLLKAVILLLLHISICFTATAQTPGLIYKPAIGNGAKILDPNADGYVSTAKTGFSGTNDEGPGISEIPYRPFPALITEPIADLSTGSSGGHTDLATPNSSSAFTGSPVAAFFDGTNVLFRIRLGGSSTASKGYSVLIDSDQKFDGTGTNPGFEYEVLLASNFSVQVIRHTGTGSSTIFTGSADQYSQRSVAASTSGGNPDYFYDFYVPLTAFGGGITASTPLRMSGITISSAQSGISGTVSDVGGVNFQAYNYDAPAAWRALIGVFPPTSLNTLQTSAFPQIAATAPVVASPILANSTSITGSSVEAPGSTITVYRSVAGGTPTLVGTTTVATNGSWSLTGLANTLLNAGDRITATVTAPNKTVSALSSPVTVQQPTACTTTPIPTLTGRSGGNPRYLTGSTPYVGRQKITIYTSTASAQGVYTYTELGSYIFTTTVANTVLPTSICPAGTTSSATCMTNITGTVEITRSGTYVITTTPVDVNGTPIGCESLRSRQLCYNATGNSAATNDYTASITSAVSGSGLTYNTISELPSNIASISGTISTYNAGISVILFKNGAQTSYRVNPTSTNWTINTSGLTLAVGDVLNVRVESSLTCGLSLSAASNIATIRATTAAPVINPITTCGPVRIVSGTSSEPGSVVTIFSNGVSTGLTSTVNASGVWSVDLSSLNSGNGVAAGVPITARAKSVSKATSVFSNAVQSAQAPSGSPTITGTISEGQKDISGTAPAGSVVTLYIEGSPFTPVTADASGNWLVKGLSPMEVFAGASVTASYKLAGSSQCESIKSPPVIVSCAPPSTTPTISSSTVAVCIGSSASVTVNNSQQGISYRLVTVTGTGSNETYTETGVSVLGTGGAITLSSDAITAATTLRVRARKISGTACDALLTGSIAVTANPLPPSNFGVTITNNNITGSSASGCAGASPTITVTNAQVG